MENSLLEIEQDRFVVEKAGAHDRRIQNAAFITLEKLLRETRAIRRFYLRADIDTFLSYES